MSAPLNDRSILVTRPAHQARNLCQLIDSNGGHSLAFPTIEIVAKRQSEAYWAELAAQPWDLFIFISANAVQYAIHDLSLACSQLPKLAAIGAKTAKTLYQHELNVDLVPDQGYTTEDLLTLPELQSLEQQRILIIRGVGGRETLADALRERGADVSYAEVYERRLPQKPDHRLIQPWQQNMVDAISITSNEGLNNLITLSQPISADMLNVPLIVISQRQADYARELGFVSVHVAHASDQDILAQLISLWAGQ